jgi:uncharacterized repeat protein (TIGR03847 family)
MPGRQFVFDSPDRFVAGTVGEPGDRTFFIQARNGDRLVSVVLEKVQVAVLAERLDRLLDELEQAGLAETEATGRPMPDAGPLDEPLVGAFRATTLTLGWDGDQGRVLVEARADLGDPDEPDDDTADALEIELDAPNASPSERAFAAAAAAFALELEEADEAELEEEDDEDGPDIRRVLLSPRAARSFVARAMAVVAAGRPPCPLCGQPLDPQGHLCPRRNGSYLN